MNGRLSTVKAILSLGDSLYVIALNILNISFRSQVVIDRCIGRRLKITLISVVHNNVVCFARRKAKILLSSFTTRVTIEDQVVL